MHTRTVHTRAHSRPQSAIMPQPHQDASMQHLQIGTREKAEPGAREKTGIFLIVVYLQSVNGAPCIACKGATDTLMLRDSETPNFKL